LDGFYALESLGKQDRRCLTQRAVIALVVQPWKTIYVIPSATRLLT